jgi:hypothetical protein
MLLAWCAYNYWQIPLIIRCQILVILVILMKPSLCSQILLSVVIFSLPRGNGAMILALVPG